MKKGARFTTLAVALALVCGLVIGAAASNAAPQLIQAYLTADRTVTYNGEVQKMADANGNAVYPISYNGTTYVPIRAVGNMLGIGVDWDVETKTVLLGDPGNGVDLIETFKPYVPYTTEMYFGIDARPMFVQNADQQTKDIGGESVSHWIGAVITAYDRTMYPCSFNLGGRYQTLTFKVYSEKDITLYVKGDNGSVLGQYSVQGAQVPQTITVDLKGTTQLTFELERPSGVEYSGDRYLWYTDIFNARLS